MAGRLNQTGMRLLKWAPPLVLSLALAGCSGLQETFGMGKNPPDEFRVMSQQPLSVPPEFELRPPGSGNEAAANEDTRTRAQRAVFGRDGSTGGGNDFEGRPGMSEGERALLSRSGAGQTPDNIRNVLDAEARQGLGAEDEGSFWDSLMFWRESPDERRSVERERRIEALEEERRGLEIERLERELDDLRSSSAGVDSTPE